MLTASIVENSMCVKYKNHMVIMFTNSLALPYALTMAGQVSVGQNIGT